MYYSQLGNSYSQFRKTYSHFRNTLPKYYYSPAGTGGLLSWDRWITVLGQVDYCLGTGGLLSGQFLYIFSCRQVTYCLGTGGLLSRDFVQFLYIFSIRQVDFCLVNLFLWGALIPTSVGHSFLQVWGTHSYECMGGWHSFLRVYEWVAHPPLVGKVYPPFGKLILYKKHFVPRLRERIPRLREIFPRLWELT